MSKTLEAQGYSCILEPETAQGRFVLSCEGRRLDISCPARLAVLLMKVHGLAYASAERVLRIGAFSLDLPGKTWRQEGGDTIILTDRETGLLEALIRAPGHRLERAALLEHVWGYHQNAETHTLETHIYRLRRKIEVDARIPAVLLTDGSGYKLSV